MYYSTVIIRKYRYKKYLDHIVLVIADGKSDIKTRPPDYFYVLNIRKQCRRKKVSFEFR